MYGYGWWMRELAGPPGTSFAGTGFQLVPAFYAWGFGGQYIFVIPQLELVVVTTSSTATGEERRSHRRTIFGLVESLIVERASGIRPPGAWGLKPEP
jgi:CubicO group peptidase (beta-lactamase class C family)